ncbi:unnamed protein product [Orchesella dallaii]|uniref:Uncharacterized protein n=1 Tax=Orchesella dallaii TaxID=48710 RepID=A0ABP1R7M4_9HEXA
MMSDPTISSHIKSGKVMDTNNLASSGKRVFPNPCRRCMILKTGVTIIAVLQIVYGAIFLFKDVFFVSVLDKLNPQTDEQKELMKMAKVFFIFNMIITCIHTLVSFGLCIGAVKKNACLCKLWVAMSVLNVISSIVGIVRRSTVSTTGMMTEARVKRATVSACIGIAVELCLIWVVVAFIRQVQRFGQKGMKNNVELGGQPGEGVPCKTRTLKT